MVDECSQSGTVDSANRPQLPCLLELLDRKVKEYHGKAEEIKKAQAIPRLQELSKIAAGIMTNDEKVQLDSTKQFRKLLSIKSNPPIQAVIDAGVVPRFVHFLGYDHNPPLQVRHFIWMLEGTISICCYFCIHMPHFLFPLYSLKRRGH